MGLEIYILLSLKKIYFSLKNAFDSVTTKAIMKTSGKQGTGKKYLQILSKMYDKSAVHFRVHELSNNIQLEK